MIGGKIIHERITMTSSQTHLQEVIGQVSGALALRRYRRCPLPRNGRNIVGRGGDGDQVGAHARRDTKYEQRDAARQMRNTYQVGNKCH